MNSHIKKKMESGDYNKISCLKDLTKQLRHDMREISADRHIRIDIMENIRLNPGPPTAEEIARKKKNNFGFVSLKKLESNIGYLKLDSFMDPAFAGETTRGAAHRTETYPYPGWEYSWKSR